MNPVVQNFEKQKKLFCPEMCPSQIFHFFKFPNVSDRVSHLFKNINPAVTN